MKHPVKLFLGALLLSGTMLGGGAALAGDSPFGYCSLLEVHDGAKASVPTAPGAGPAPSNSGSPPSSATPAPAANPAGSPAGPANSTPPQSAPAATPAAPGSAPAGQAADAPKVPDINELLKQTTDAADIVNRILSVAAPVKPEELEGMYGSVYSTIVSEYIEPSRITALSVYKDKYQGKLKNWADLDGAIADLVHAVGDRWTWYHGPVERVRAAIDAKEKLVDFGANLRQEVDGTFTIEFLDPGSTAQLGGLREGDKIISINGQDLAGMDKDAATRLGRKSGGDELHVVSLQDGKRVETTYTLREPADDANAANADVIYGNIGYIKLPSFMSVPLFQKLVEKLVDMQQKTPSGLQGLVLDLRYNGGGLVNMAKSLIQLLQDQGVVLHERKRDDMMVVDTTTTLIPMPEIEKSTHSPEELAMLKAFKQLPLVILINGSSASASEIVTGTLKDSRPNTTVMGERSFGKGVEMSIRDLPTCGQLAVTSAAYTTPKGTWLHKVGIAPDVVVHQVRGDSGDAQLVAAVNYLKDKTEANGARVAVQAPEDRTILGKLPERPVEVEKVSWTRAIAPYRADIIRGAVAIVLLGLGLAYLSLTRRKEGGK